MRLNHHLPQSTPGWFSGRVPIATDHPDPSPDTSLQLVPGQRGVSGWNCVIGGGSDASIAATMLACVFPENAGFPVAISYSTAPKAKMSERASASFPSSCSGDMYWNVPTIMPRAVRGGAADGPDIVMVKLEAGGALAVAALARPKSISFVPVFVSMMLPGFRSR